MCKTFTHSKSFIKSIRCKMYKNFYERLKKIARFQFQVELKTEMFSNIWKDCILFSIYHGYVMDYSWKIRFKFKSNFGKLYLNVLYGNIWTKHFCMFLKHSCYILVLSRNVDRSTFFRLKWLIFRKKNLWRFKYEKSQIWYIQMCANETEKRSRFENLF